MSLRTIKLTKEWLSNTNVKTCNHDIHFLGRERYVVREQNSQSKAETTTKKICNIDLHFLGREWEYYHGGPCYEEKRKEEVGNDYSNDSSGKCPCAFQSPCQPPSSPNPELKTTNQETETQKFSLEVSVEEHFLLLLTIERKCRKGCQPNCEYKKLNKKDT